MKTNIQQLIFEDLKSILATRELVILNKRRFIEFLSEIAGLNDLTSIKNRIFLLKEIIADYRKDQQGILSTNANEDTILLYRDVLDSKLNQILRLQTLEKVKCHLKKLEESFQGVKMNKINDIDLSKWKEYNDIITDSLWILDKRDNSGAHCGWYWGNFIPQIPHQMMLRYTKKGDWVLDAFVGSGTTLIECRRLGRNGIGIELNQEVAQKARELIKQEANPNNVISEVVVGDSRTINIKEVIAKYKINQVQFVIMHPPYHDIIKFSDNENDLSNAKSTEEFLKVFGEVVDNVIPYLEKSRYFALVIGDKYSKGEWIPLGFYCMQEILKRKHSLKSIIVKNFKETKGKKDQQKLWRYRALAGGFYVFKHEYIMLFKKR